MANKIIVVGSANVDLVIHSAKMPKLGETLVGSKFQTNAGGKGLNQAVAIAKLGGDVSFFGSCRSRQPRKALAKRFKRTQHSL